MKRSEVLDLLRRGLVVIDRGQNHDGTQMYENKQSKEAADFLLTRLESLGMLPPEAEFKYYKNDGELLDIQWSNDWEPENEDS